ncbi:DUF6207 family protein [Streptomyces acidicola]
MRQIYDAHVAAAGLAVVKVAAADDETAFAVRSVVSSLSTETMPSPPRK